MNEVEKLIDQLDPTKVQCCWCHEYVLRKDTTTTNVLFFGSGKWTICKERGPCANRRYINDVREKKG